MSRRVSELLLASVIAARATSYLFSKLILQGMGVFNLMAVRFLLAFALLAVPFFPRLRRMDRRTLLGGAIMGAALILHVLAFGEEATARFFGFRTFRAVVPNVLPPLISAVCSSVSISVPSAESSASSSTSTEGLTGWSR